MSATTHAEINFSLSNQTGLYSESQNVSLSCQTREVMSGGGEVIPFVNFKHVGTWTISGALKTDESPTWDLGTAVTLANAVTLTDFIPGYTSGGQYPITGVDLGLSAEQEERRDLSGAVYPFSAAAS